jgi:hypothetical protein
VKALPYAVWLPVVHLAIMIPLISLEAKGWKFIPELQRKEEYDKAHPPKPKSSQDTESQIGWDPDYKYGPPISVKAIYTVEFLAASLVGWCGHPSGNG